MSELADFERSKYLRAYERSRYRAKSPHKLCLERCKKEVQQYDSYANFGCGSGLLDRYLLELRRGILVDHVSVLWPEVAEHRNLVRFIEASLFEQFPMFEVPYAVCTDVMEHIPPEKVDVVLANIAARTPECFFQISLNASGPNDEEKYGGHLHLTVESPEWWSEKLSKHFGRLLWAHTQTKPKDAPWQPTKTWFNVTATNYPETRKSSKPSS